MLGQIVITRYWKLSISVARSGLLQNPAQGWPNPYILLHGIIPNTLWSPSLRDVMG